MFLKNINGKPDRSPFAGAKHWIFDLDNTLYPESCNLFQQIDQRMKAFISGRLGVDRDEAYRIQKEYLISHGTTLRGLMDHHNVAPDDFLDFVHDIDLEPIRPNPGLARCLRRLEGRKYIFTNGTRAHAEAVLERLGLSEAFDRIFDIRSADFVPKPAPEAYQRLIKDCGIEPLKAVLVEDMVRNLEPAHRLGMATVWLNTGSQWGRIGHDEAFVGLEIDDLGGWLEGISREANAVRASQ